MPNYDYLCDQCKHSFEEMQSITADPLTICPMCQQPSLRRLIGRGSAVIFRGSGFYCNEYPSDSKSKRLAKEEGRKSDTKSGSGEGEG